MKRPVTFKDWRALLARETRYLGDWALLRFDGRRIHIDRTLYQRLRRVRRIQARLEVEAAVKDRTYYEALLEMILRSDP